ncbi:hypothetical protein Bbelb_440190, partial [Branchiostoma belcheri]
SRIQLRLELTLKELAGLPEAPRWQNRSPLEKMVKYFAIILKIQRLYRCNSGVDNFCTDTDRQAYQPNRLCHRPASTVLQPEKRCGSIKQSSWRNGRRRGRRCVTSPEPGSFDGCRGYKGHGNEEGVTAMMDEGKVKGVVRGITGGQMWGNVGPDKNDGDHPNNRDHTIHLVPVTAGRLWGFPAASEGLAGTHKHATAGLAVQVAEWVLAKPSSTLGFLPSQLINPPVFSSMKKNGPDFTSMKVRGEGGIRTPERNRTMFGQAVMRLRSLFTISLAANDKQHRPGIINRCPCTCKMGNRHPILSLNATCRHYPCHLNAHICTHRSGKV